jgi:1,2-phenylacetyl-CoA epoxidase catalytic subunit
MDPKDSVSYMCFPEDLRIDIAKSIIAEEPRHIAVGREIVIRYGGGVEKRRRLMRIQIDKMKAWLPKAVADLQMIGAQRVTPLPIVE